MVILSVTQMLLGQHLDQQDEFAQSKMDPKIQCGCSPDDVF